MKKTYCKPSAELLVMEAEDIITLSAGKENADFDDGPSLGFDDFT